MLHKQALSQEQKRYVESYASGCPTVVALIRRRAALSPAAVAVVDKTSALSYEELDRQSDALAIRLRQNGVGAGKYVGIMLPRTKEYIVAILATLKAGGTYVPLDAACPRIRLNTIVTQSSMSCLIIRGGKIPTWDAQPVQSVIDMEDMSYASPGYACAPDYSEEVGAACLMFTSGTTGEPKGVIISHRYIKSLALYGSRLFQLTERDRVMLHPSFGVIASFGNIYPALISGSSVHIISDDLRHDIMALRRYIVHAGISGGVLYTAIGSQLLDSRLTSMRWMMMGGETVLLYGIKYPQTVDGFVVADPVSIVKAPKSWSKGLTGDPKKQLPNVLSTGLNSDPRVVHRIQNDPANLHHLTVGILQNEIKGAYSLREHLTGFKDPLLFLQGQKDGLIDYHDSLEAYAMIASNDKELQVRQYNDCLH